MASSASDDRVTMPGHMVYGDDIDKDTFEQVLEMDDDDERDFSREIVFDFFTQARSTFAEIDAAINNKELKQLSDLGHFLKGSSATLGFVKMQNSCEKIQRYGKKENLDGSPGPNEQTCLANITEALKEVKTELNDVRRKMRAFYGVEEDDDEDDEDEEDEEEDDDDDEEEDDDESKKVDGQNGNSHPAKEDEESDGEGEDDEEEEEEDKKAANLPAVIKPVPRSTVEEKRTARV